MFLAGQQLFFPKAQSNFDALISVKYEKLSFGRQIPFPRITIKRGQSVNF